MSQKSEKYKYTFEIYCLVDKLELKHWQQFYKALTTHLGVVGGKFFLIWVCQDNIVRFFIQSNKDIGTISNSIEGVLLRPCKPEDVNVPHANRGEHFVNFVGGGNILDLKERFQVKKGKNLQFATFSVRSLTYENAYVTSNLYFQLPGDQWSKSFKVMTAFPANLFAIDFATNTRYLKKTVPRYLNIEKSVQMLSSENINGLLEVDTFPYFPKNYYLNLTSYEFDKHSFIIGASGSGKSKFISLFVDRLYKSTALAMNYRVIVIDPHASLANDFDYINNKKVINFGNESTELFAGNSTDISAATELTGTLFKSLMGEASTSKTDRLMRFSLYVLLTSQAMSLSNLKRFLTDAELRNQILSHVEGYVPDNIIHFFGADFNELRTKYYNEAIAPIVTLVDEMQMQPALVGEGELSLSKTIEDHFLTVFSLNKVSMGEKVVKTVAGLLIQQIFLLAQARVFNQRVLLIIDEVSLVQNPALAAILAEARKFNLTVILTQQYFGQIEKDLRDAIFANTYNYYTFKVSEEDARALEGNLNIELPKELIEAEHEKGLKESEVRVKIMTELHPRECLVRVLSGGQVVPAIKARTLDAPVADASTLAHKEAELQEYKQKANKKPSKFVETSSADTYSNRPSLDVAPEQFANSPMPSSSGITQDTTQTPPIDAPPIGGGYSPESPNFSSWSPETSGERLEAKEHTINPEEIPSPDIYELHPEDRIMAKTQKAARLGALVASNYSPAFSSAPQQPVNANALPAPASTLAGMQSLGPQTFNLSDLLAQHSSSREKIKKG
jgi:Helicase HerA, central domain